MPFCSTWSLSRNALAPVELYRVAGAFEERRALEVGEQRVERFFVELGGEHQLGAFGMHVGVGDDGVDRREDLVHRGELALQAEAVGAVG